MLPRRQEYGMKRSGGARSGSVINFRSAMKLSSGRRSSAVLPSLLTFLVIVASGGLLLMIEKGMLNGMETPSPRSNGRRLDFHRGQAGGRSPDAADLESQVEECNPTWRFSLNISAFRNSCWSVISRRLKSLRAVSSVKWLKGRFLVGFRERSI